MIFIVDLSSIGTQHEQFNIAFTAMLLKQHKHAKFWGEKQHIQHIQNGIYNSDFNFDRSQITFEDFKFYYKKQSGRLDEFLQEWYSYRAIHRICTLAAIQNVECVYVISIRTISHFLFKKFSKILPAKVSIVLHGELGFLPIKNRITTKIWNFFLEKAIENFRPNISYIILGKPIFDAVKRILPAISENEIKIIDHPYPFSDIKISLKERIKDIKISHFGVATVHKNSELFFQLAKIMKTRYLDHGLNFYVCGRVYEDMSEHLNRFVQFKPIGVFWKRSELDLIMADSTFCIFLNDVKKDALVPSGAFFDAINAEVPILYIDNNYIDYYQSLSGGLIGHSFASFQELVAYIDYLMINGIDEANYASMVSNIRKLKKEILNINAISEQLLS